MIGQGVALDVHDVLHRKHGDGLGPFGVKGHVPSQGTVVVAIAMRWHPWCETSCGVPYGPFWHDGFYPM